MSPEGQRSHATTAAGETSKHDGYRLTVRRDGLRVRCFTRNGHNWADRFPAIVDAALRIKAQSFLIDGEAVIARDDGTPDFHALRSQRRGHEAALFAFDLIEHDGHDLTDLPLIERKRRLARLLGRAKRRAIRFTEHLTGDGPTVSVLPKWKTRRRRLQPR
jgi:ATP-dependent DNA ligase